MEPLNEFKCEIKSLIFVFICELAEFRDWKEKQPPPPSYFIVIIHIYINCFAC